MSHAQLLYRRRVRTATTEEGLPRLNRVPPPELFSWWSGSGILNEQMAHTG